MRLFADHCFFLCGVEFLRKEGYHVVQSAQVGLNQSPDEDIVPYCKKENLLLLTLDLDFSSLYRFPLGTHRGIVIFKISPFAPDSLLAILPRIMQRNLFPTFQDALVIAQRDKIRIVRQGTPTQTIQ